MANTLILADVHGNLPALEAVLAKGDQFGCTRIFSLGDVAGYGGMLDACVELLRARSAVHLQGNHDSYLLTGTGCPRSVSANVCLAAQSKLVQPETLEWLAKAPLRHQWDGLNMVHGGWNDPLDEYLAHLSPDVFKTLPGRYFFSAHTHVPFLHAEAAFVYCNPGAVGQPRDGDPQAAFAVLRDGQVSLHRVAYDIERAVAAMRDQGLPEHLYRNLFAGTRIGGGITPPPVFTTS